jgi:hypothetical protein
MGVYDGEELEVRPGDRAKDVSAAEGLHERITAAVQQNGGSGEGFRAGVVEDTLSGGPAEPTQEVSSPEAAQVAAQPENEASGEAQPTPATAQKRGKPPKAPRTAEQYRAHVAWWLFEATTEQALEERWRSEMKLRNSCGVTSDIKSEIRASLIDQRIAELRK